jgi:hypothetical protein
MIVDGVLLMGSPISKMDVIRHDDVPCQGEAVAVAHFTENLDI